MPSRVEKVERVADLLFALLHANEPLTLVQIVSRVPGYPEEPEARRTQFERDKRTLRESGVPITVTSPNSSAQDGYQILAAEYYLPDLGLTDDERNALRLALAQVRIEGTTAAEIAVKIGAAPEATLPAVMTLPQAPFLGQLAAAVRARATVGFTYRGRARVVEPYVLAFRGGHWYLVGRDRAGEGDARRTFRVDRIAGPVETGRAGEVAEVADLDVARELAFSLRAAPEDAGPAEMIELLVDASASAAAIEMGGEDAVLERDRQGRARLVFPVADEQAVVDWVLGFGDAAEVLAPAPLRALVAGRLAVLAEDEGADLAGLEHLASGAAPSAAPTRARSAPPDAGRRLRRIIAMLTYLASVGSAKVADLAARFGLTEELVVSELELAACFGVPPYTPDQLLEVLVVDDAVHVHRLAALERPLRLTPDEGFALAAATRALLRIEGVDSVPLGSALGKLEAVLGRDRVHIEVASPPLLDELRRAAATNTVVEIDYLGTGRAEPTRRRVEPVAVVFREGRFYLDAYCHLASDWRRFAVANVRGVTATATRGEARTVPPEFLGPRAFVGGPGTRRATIVAPALSAAFLEPFADGPATALDDDRLLVTLAIGDEGWLGRLLCRLGPGAQVVAPAALRRAKPAVARAALARYR